MTKRFAAVMYITEYPDESSSNWRSLKGLVERIEAEARTVVGAECRVRVVGVNFTSKIESDDLSSAPPQERSKKATIKLWCYIKTIGEANRVIDHFSPVNLKTFWLETIGGPTVWVKASGVVVPADEE